MTPDEEAAKARGQVTPLGPGVVDRGAFNYGGDPMAAARESGALAAEAQHAQGRQGEQINTTNADAARGQANNSRDNQNMMANMMLRRANGQTPSIAGMVGARDMNRVAAEQSSAAASARGPAAMALAQQGAAANTAAGQSNISNSTQINSAVERQQAEQGAMGAFSAIRGGDQSQQGQDFSQSAAQAQINAQQRAQNDAYTTNTRQQGIGIQTTQLNADMNRDAQEQAGHFNAAAAQANKDRDDDANLLGYVSAGAQTAAAVAPMVASDERTKVPVTWGGGGAPEEPALAPSTWGTGAGTTSQDVYRSAAARALDQQAEREGQSHLAHGMGPQAYDTNPGRRWDAEDLGLSQAKQRNGLELSAKEEANKASIQHRQGQDRLADSSKKDAKDDKAKDAPKPTTGEQIGSASGAALSGIGKTLGAMSANKRSQETFHYQPAQAYALPNSQGPMVPMVTTSDDHAKVALAQREAFSAGMQHANDAAESGKFGPVPDYVQEHGKRQPKAADRKAESPTKRADAGPQNAENAASEKSYDRAAAASLAAVPLGWGGTLGAFHAQKSEDALQHNRSIMAQRMASPPREREMTSFTRESGTEKKQPPPTERGAAVSAVEREQKTQPGARAYANQVMFGRPAEITDADMSMSDEHTKRRVGTLGEEMPHADMAEAARSMRSVPYAYKDQFAGKEGQAPGEVNVGPVAQEMQKSKVAATAVKEDPSTGMRAIDIPKYTKVLGGIAADHQEQLDEQDRKISMMARRLGGRR